MSGRRQLAVALTAAGLALGAGACGSDDEPTTTSATTTEETVSASTSSTTESTSSSTTTESTTDQTTAEETTTATDEIELEPEGDDSGGSGPRGDSEENDKPPQEGSPEASFEEFCDLNPKECG